MSAENKFNEIVKDFNAVIKTSIDDALSKIHSEMVPYLNDDTEHNAIYRAHDIVSDILSSNFTLEDDKIVCDGWKTKLTANDHDRLIDKLAEKCADTAAQKKIERLERQLKEAWEVR